MTYHIYHIPGKKIGVTCDLEERVTNQQGYEPNEYEVLGTTKDIDIASGMEIYLQKEYGYEVDRVPYNKLKCNKMRINVTEQTTTFPCPVNKLKGQLMDNIGLEWDTEFGDCIITTESIKWIIKNVKESMYNIERCYIYNKAFARYFDNNDAFSEKDVMDQYSGKTLTGALSPTGVRQEKECCDYLGVCECAVFDDIRIWAEERGLYNAGDPKTQALKLVEEVGETCRAILKQDEPEIIDGIGDCVVVLTNLAHLCDTSIEECTRNAYNEIKNRKGVMDNGTFKKDD
jgi:NTP pyrophosphatase (non-canonical NTP hydrolase)